MQKSSKNNYKRGAHYERVAQDELQAAGYFVMRAAGSHGPVDLVALKDGELARLIQIKSGDVKSEAKHLYTLACANLPREAWWELWQRDAGEWRQWRWEGRQWLRH